MLATLTGYGTPVAQEHIDDLHRAAAAWRLARQVRSARPARRTRHARSLQPATAR